VDESKNCYTIDLTDNMHGTYFSTKTYGMGVEDCVEVFVQAMRAMTFHDETIIRGMEQYIELNKPSHRVEDY
jgi:hypothetical protein